MEPSSPKVTRNKVAEYVVRINGQDHGVFSSVKEAKELISEMNIHDSLVKVEIVKRIDKVIHSYVPKLTKILVAEDLGLDDEPV
jgi:hypothetical protein